MIGGGNVALDVARTRGARRRARRTSQRNLPSCRRSTSPRSAVRFGAREVHRLLPRVGERDAGRRRRRSTRPARRASASATGSARSASSARTASSPASSSSPSPRVFDETGRFSPSSSPGSETVMPDRHRDPGHRADRRPHVPPPRGRRSRRAAGRISDRSRDPGHHARPGSTPAATRRSARASPSTRSPTASARPRRSTSSCAARPGPSDGRSRSTCTAAIDAGPRLRGHPRQQPPTRPISRRIGIAEVEECFGERRGAAARARAACTAGPTPSSTQDADERDRVHPLRRLPGRLPGGLHRDRARRPSARSRLPDAARELAADPRGRPARRLDLHQGRGDLHPLRPLRRALPGGHDHHAELLITEVDTMPDDSEDDRLEAPASRAGATSSPRSAWAPAPWRRPGRAS